MRHFILASLLCLSFIPLYGANSSSNQPPQPTNEDQKNNNGEIAGPENALDYNLYDRMQNKQEQQQRQQYFYYQNQQQNQYQKQQNAPQYTRKRQPMHNQYFDPRNE